MRLFALLSLLPLLLAAPSPEPYNPFFPAPLDPHNTTSPNLTLLDARPDRSVPVYPSSDEDKVTLISRADSAAAAGACHANTKRDSRDEGQGQGEQRKIRNVPKKIKRKGLVPMSPRSPLPHPKAQPAARADSAAAVCRAKVAKVKRQDPADASASASASVSEMAIQAQAEQSSSPSSSPSASASITSSTSFVSPSSTTGPKSCRARPTASSSSSLVARANMQPRSMPKHGAAHSRAQAKKHIRKVKRASSTCKPKSSGAIPSATATATTSGLGGVLIPSGAPSSSSASSVAAAIPSSSASGAASSSASSIVTASSSASASESSSPESSSSSSSLSSSSSAIPTSSVVPPASSLSAVFPSSSSASSAANSSSSSSSAAAAPSSSSVAPTTAAPSSASSSAPPAASSSAAPTAWTVDPEGNGPFQGLATYYDTDVGYGACGKWHKNSEATAAASWDLFDNWPGYNGLNPNVNPICGQRLRVSYQGKSVVVEIQDRCPGCSKRWLDLSAGAFQQLADKDVGFLGAAGYTPGLTWEWVAPTTPLPQNLPFTL